jgi:hypothetical protein
MASLEEISAVPGFGGKAAAELKAFLEARTIEEPGNGAPKAAVKSDSSAADDDHLDAGAV